MALAEWGRWDDSLAEQLGGLGLEELKLAYLRRKRWEARLLAIEVVKALFGKTDSDSGSVAISESGKRYQKVGAERFLNG